VRLSLNAPVRLFVDRSNDLAARLTQEFVRVRTDAAEEREAIVLGVAPSLSPRPTHAHRYKRTHLRKAVLHTLAHACTLLCVDQRCASVPSIAV
jgi:hypothetical protein